MTKYQVLFKKDGTGRFAIIKNGTVSVQRFNTVSALVNHLNENDYDVCVGDAKVEK